MLATYPSCPSSKPLPRPRVSTSRPGTSPRRPDRRRVRRPPSRGPARGRRTGRAGRLRDDARGQHHQAARHRGIRAAAQGGDQGTQARGLQLPRLPRGTRRPTRSATPALATTRSRAARSTRSARGQLGPSRPCCRQELRQQAPALDGCLEQRQQDQCRHHGPRRLPPNEQSVILPAADTLTIRHTAADGTETILGTASRSRAAESLTAPHLGKALDAFLATRSPAPRPRACSSRCTSRPP